MPRRTRFRTEDPLPKAVQDTFSLKSAFARHVDYASKAEHEKEIRDKFLEKFAENPIRRTDAAHFVGVSLSTVERWIAKYEDFADAVNDILENINDIVEERLYRGAMGEIYISKEQVTALLGWLNAHRSRQYDPDRLKAIEASNTTGIQVHFHLYPPENQSAPQLPAEVPVVIEAEVIDASSS